MKKNSFLTRMLTATTAILLFLLLAGNSPQDTTQDTTDNGRYQLAQGYFTSISRDASLDEKSIFKIDTQTGDSWLFIEAVDSSGISRYWRAISN